MDLPSPRDNQFLFLDMNAFFASCEQHRNPALRGKPVAVTPTLASTGCIIAASYEAKQRGVTTGCGVGQAKTLIPDIQIIKSDPRYYTAIHRQLAQFLETEIAPRPLKLSIDEFAIPLDKNEQWTPNAHRLALFIQSRIMNIFSPALRCSIGIGPNLFLAKLGTEIQKPNGLVIIQIHSLETGFGQLKKLRDIPGINYGMERRLHILGIRTSLEFYQAPRPLLHTAFGICGNAWWYNLHGYRIDHKTSPTKSISHSHVLAPTLRTKIKARAVLYKLWIKVFERLRAKQLAAQNFTVVVKSAHRGPDRNPVKYHQSDRWIWNVTTRPTQNAFALFRTLTQAYERELPKSFSPVQIYVVVSHLQPYQAQWLGLYPEDTPKVDRVLKAMDVLNQTYGRWTVKPASLLSIGDSAPNRITFQVPDYEMD